MNYVLLNMNIYNHVKLIEFYISYFLLILFCYLLLLFLLHNLPFFFDLLLDKLLNILLFPKVFSYLKINEIAFQIAQTNLLLLSFCTSNFSFFYFFLKILLFILLKFIKKVEIIGFYLIKLLFFK